MHQLSTMILTSSVQRRRKITRMKEKPSQDSGTNEFVKIVLNQTVLEVVLVEKKMEIMVFQKEIISV